MVHRRHDILAVVLAVIALAAYASFRAEYRLRTQMPADFFDASRVSPEKRASETKVAQAYWKSAVTQVQWKYGYAHRLPDDPPTEFSITAAEGGAAGVSPAVRARYWQRLREVWDISTVWEEHYEWNSLWVKGSVQSAGGWLEHLMRRVTGSS